MLKINQMSQNPLNVSFQKRADPLAVTMEFSAVTAARIIFTVLGCFMLLTLIYTIVVDGLPFRQELLTPWMAATLVDFYINVTAIAAWVAYKEASWLSATIWIVLLISLGSITTCTYIVIQLFKFSGDIKQGPLCQVLLLSTSRTALDTKRYSTVFTARILFSALGCLMFATLIYTLLTDGSPFRKELLTPWMTATLIDFYLNVFAIAVWIVYKEATWMGAFFWVILLICLGSITTCAYTVIQLFHLSYHDPVHLILLSTPSRQVFKMQPSW